MAGISMQAKAALVAAGLLAGGLLLGSALADGGKSQPPAAIARPTRLPGMHAAAPAPKPVKPAPATMPTPASAETAAAAPIQIQRVLPISGPIRYGSYYWDESGVPAGPITVTVDIGAETMSVWRGGYEIGATAITFGLDSNPTPTGTFPITQKQVHHVSNIYAGGLMPYMQRLTSDGVTIHGAEVKGGYATHGCIGVPIAFAKKLYEVTRIGTPVIVTRGKIVGIGAKI